MATKKKAVSTKTVEIAGAAALATAAAAAAGYYFYGTAKAKKHRHSASVWAKGLKSDVTKKVKTLKKVDAKSVSKIVDEVAATYHTVRGVAGSDVHHAARELKSNWQKVYAELKPSAKVKKAVKSASPSSVKKKVKKAVKKELNIAKKTVRKIAKKI